ncbi:MAG: energy-coupled thiamine transporter ThiT [Eubacteriales bacterium]
MTTEKKTNKIIALVETAMMVAVAFVLEIVCGFIPDLWAMGGSICLCAVPLFYLSYRRGWKWAVAGSLVHSCVRMMMGISLPPANDFWSIALCILLDYVLAFASLGTAELFARPFIKKGKALLGYGIGAVGASFLRFICSFISVGILFGSYAPEEMNVWGYSLAYNGSYMLLNAVLAAVIIVLLCAAVDPRTLKPIKSK